MKWSQMSVVLIAIFSAALVMRSYSLHEFSARGRVRYPAAIEPNLLESTSDVFFETVAKKRILLGTKFWNDNGSVAFIIGHFLAKNPAGETARLCDIYSDLTLTFVADGIAISGEKPTMTVETTCLVSETLDHTAPIWIPVAEIKKGQAVDGELRFTTPSKLLVKMRNIPGEWPNRWLLTMIKLSGQTESQILLIDNSTIQKMAQVPASFTLDEP